MIYKIFCKFIKKKKTAGIYVWQKFKKKEQVISRFTLLDDSYLILVEMQMEKMGYSYWEAFNYKTSAYHFCGFTT